MNKKIKQSIYVIALASFATVAVFFTSCDNNNNKYSSERAEDAAEDLRDAKKDLDEAQREYTIKYNDFKREMDNKITENDKAIAALKADVRERNAEAKANWNTAVNDLERKNQSLKDRINDYKADGNANWDEFKREFNHDMDRLGEALKDMTQNNVK
jgi:uncharacterized protein (DUF3084 family)